MVSRWLFNRSYNQDTGRFVGAGVFAMLSLFMLVDDAGAQSSQLDWTTETRLYLSGITSYRARDHVAVTHNALAASAEVRFGPVARPWSVSLFSEYRYSSDDRYSDQVNLGTYINFDWHRWDARAYVFVNKAPHTDDSWMYAGRLRYRFADDHKVGIETFSTFSKAKLPTFMLGYYGNPSDRLSVTFAAGRGTGDGPDLSARLEFVWQVF